MNMNKDKRREKFFHLKIYKWKYQQRFRFFTVCYFHHEPLLRLVGCRTDYYKAHTPIHILKHTPIYKVHSYIQGTRTYTLILK